jgi:ribosomal protein L11 methyltransferase
VSDTSSARSWPALDIHPVSELLPAALVDYEVSAVDERSSDDWRVFFATAGERDAAAAALRISFPELTVRSVDVPDENWAARSQASLRAVRIGNIVVAPPWDAPALPSGDRAQRDRVIVIEPSMGFGTGHHATTRLCLEALQQIEVAGHSLLDVGTGSGVLAIAASILGASRAVGIDDDDDAISAAQENLKLNPQAEVSLLVADLRSVDVGPADIVTANLTGGLLVAASRTLQDLVARDGRLILSGLMAVEETDVLAAYAPWRVEHRTEEDEWICLTVVRF